MRMRTIDAASEYLLKNDPETALTKSALRRLVTSGAVPSVKIGSKYLIDLEILEQYLSGGLPTASVCKQSSGAIRRVEV